MSTTLRVQNYAPTNTKNAFTLDADVAAGATTLTLKSTIDAAANDIIIVGQLGAPSSEKLTISSVTNDTTIVLTSATQFNHKRFEQITDIAGDEINLYRATNIDGAQPLDSSFALLSTANLDFTKLTTDITDAAGSASYWYKYTYLNSISSAETLLADSTSQRGGGYGHYCSIDDVKTEAFGPAGNTNIVDSLVDSRRIDAEQEINAELYNVYTLPFTTPVPALIKQANRLIAAGLLLKGEYGAMSTGNQHSGDDKLTTGRELVTRIKSRELTLTDPSGKSLLNQAMVSSWPNAQTDQTGSDTTYEVMQSNNLDYGPAFKKSDIF